jgi:predicted anti-sigma-YlaC factor YlaD
MASRRLLKLRPAACERARSWASLQLDGQLSELEATWLRTHLRACEDCSEFGATIAAVTSELRAAEPVLPATDFRPTPRRRRRSLTIAATAAAAAAAVAVGSLAGALAKHSGSPSLRPTAGGVAATQEPYLEQEYLAMLAHPLPQHGRTVAV